MQGIELYFGSRNPLNRGEQAVLRRLIDWLVTHRQRAVILCDLVLGSDQIDIFVGTDTTTLQLEVKEHHWPVSGKQNGDWTMHRDQGDQTLGNGFRQAIDNNQALRNAMSRLVGIEASYPNGAVVFEPCRHPDTEIEIPAYEKRVRIVDAQALDLLLSTPGHKPWPLTWLSRLAQAENLIPQPDLRAASAPPMAAAAAPLAPPPAAALPAVAPRAIDEPVPRGPASRPFAPDRPFVPSDVIEVAPTRPLARHAPIAALAVVVAAFYFVHPVSLPASAALTAPAPAPASAARRGRHPAPRHAVAHRHPRHAAPAAGAPAPSVATPTPAPAEAAPGAALAPAAAIVCPDGVDRLGCNGRAGVLPAPQCPPGFQASGDTCARAATP
ncbi:nuclease-related domain-containing protein [Burkholderia glumae]|uniref:nuclease-related domain-containing protein n=1 Tax=Burkholderia glumae TaxID=337 RepID=UPI001462C1CF|nr:nuclease-related domain-containing protein [Burkholderia glumae]QJP68998.1 NERD domain-containing protein [Burkholderia glumae]